MPKVTQKKKMKTQVAPSDRKPKEPFLSYDDPKRETTRGGQITQYGSPDGKPKVRPKDKSKPTAENRRKATNKYFPSAATEPRTQAFLGGRAEESRKIEKRHKRAQQERIAGRRNRKRLKKKGVKVTDAFLSATGKAALGVK